MAQASMPIDTHSPVLRGICQYPVVRDLNFLADKPISAYADTARIRGLIIT